MSGVDSVVLIVVGMVTGGSWTFALGDGEKTPRRFWFVQGMFAALFVQAVAKLIGEASGL